MNTASIICALIANKAWGRLYASQTGVWQEMGFATWVAMEGSDWLADGEVLVPA